MGFVFLFPTDATASTSAVIWRVASEMSYPPANWLSVNRFASDTSRYPKHSNIISIVFLGILLIRTYANPHFARDRW